MNIFGDAQALWHMDNLLGGEDCPYELLPEGKISFERLQGSELEESLKRGSDGNVLTLFDADLRLNMYQTVRFRPPEGSVSLYIRAKIEEGTAGCLYYSDYLAININRSRLVSAFVGTKTKNGRTFREMPLCYEKTNGWKDIILSIDDNILRIYINGVLRGKYDVPEETVSPVRDDIIIGAFRCCKPDTYSNGAPFARFREITYDTVALWHRGLSEEEIAYLSGRETVEEPVLAGHVCELLKAYNEFFDASVEGDSERCSELWKILKNGTKDDKNRPSWHLSQPFGFIFDPCGAFYNRGKYHVYSYHNIEYLLNYSSLDHYESDDLVHWHQVGIGPFADCDADVYSIYLLNHFYDGEGNLRALYTGQGTSGKCGILARVSDDMTEYTDRHAVITKYHHDGHVFRHGDKWYTITSKLCKGQREGDKGDPVMMWSSPDLEHWKEEGEIFCQKKSPDTMGGFMEFPYLLNFGEKDVLILGGHPVRYWIGHFDWDKIIFVPDEEKGKLLDNTNPFHCFNPLAVDNKGEGGAERRLLMAMYGDVGSGDREIQWGCCHVMPRVLTLENDHLRQDPSPEFEGLRAEECANRDIILSDGDIYESDYSGDSFEIRAVFETAADGKASVILKNVDEPGSDVTITYDRCKDTYSVNGCVRHGGEFAAYQKQGARKNSPVELRIFADRQLLEIFVNGQSASTSFACGPAMKRPCVMAEGKCVCRDFTVWTMKNT